jgi:hypothetical protein
MRSGIVAVSAGALTFVTLAALALPRLETSLTFVPIFAISGLVGFIAFVTPKVFARIKKPN